MASIRLLCLSDGDDGRAISPGLVAARASVDGFADYQWRNIPPESRRLALRRLHSCSGCFRLEHRREGPAPTGKRRLVTAPVPLILFSPPSIMREIALATLERSGRPWRIVCTSDSLSGLRAASLAGLGITVVSEGLMPAGLTEISGRHGLPDLGLVELVVMGSDKAVHGPAAELADVILTSGIRV